MHEPHAEVRRNVTSSASAAGSIGLLGVAVLALVAASYPMLGAGVLVGVVGTAGVQRIVRRRQTTSAPESERTRRATRRGGTRPRPD